MLRADDAAQPAPAVAITCKVGGKDLQMDGQHTLQVVGIGASAGGVKALQEFFEALPDRVGAAFVVIMHLDPDARSEMVAILATRTSMPVRQVEGTLRLEIDNVYVIAPNSQLLIEHQMISALALSLSRPTHANWLSL